MATIDPVLVGTTPDDGTGDPLRNAFIKLNSNEANLNSQLNLAQPKPTERVMINTKSDLPTPAGGIITLAADVEYLIGADINLGTDRLVAGGSPCIINGIDNSVASITYTGTGDLVTATDALLSMNNVTLICSSGRGINWNDSTDTFISISQVNMACDKVAILNSTGTLGSFAVFRQMNLLAATTDMIEMTGDWRSLLWETANVPVTAGAALTITGATFVSIVLDKLFVVVASGTTFLVGDADSANLVSGGVAVVSRILSSGAGDLLSGVTTDDTRWEFGFNSELPTTRPDAFIYSNDNALETSLTEDTPVKVNAVFTETRVSHFTSDSTGKITYIGERPITVPIAVSTTISAASGVNKAINAYLAVNGSEITASKMPNQVGANDPKNTTVIWQLTLAPNDFMEVFVENTTDSINLIVEVCKFSIN